MATEDKMNNFNIPEGYFDTLADKIRTRVFIEELKEKNLGNGFSVPENYFENLEAKLYKTPNKPLEVKSKKSAKIISLSFVKYAAAASVLLVLSIVIYTYQSTNKLQSQLASLPNKDIEMYLQNNTTASDMPLIIENVDDIIIEVDNNIDTKELKNYLIETI